MTLQEIIGFNIIVLFLVGISWSLLMLYRNQKVFVFRITVAKMIIDNIAAHLQEPEIEDIELAYETFRSVSYERMMYRFWVPLKVQYWWTDEELKVMFPKYDRPIKTE